jgi:geranyl-CoA carboxylase alpha subunit
VRIDDGIAEGGEVSPWYDAMVAKLIVHGRDRADAVRRLVTAIEDSPLLGVANNGRFLRDLLQHPDFAAARLTTTRLDEWAATGGALMQRPRPDDACWLAAAALAARGDCAADAPAGLRPASIAWQTLALQCDGETRRWRLRFVGDAVEFDDGRRVQLEGREAHRWRFTIDGITRSAVALRSADGWHIAHQGASFVFAEPSPQPDQRRAADPGRAHAPVAGVVAQVLVKPGDAVSVGQPLICVEAMKMEMWLNAQAGGTVRAVHVREREAVSAGALMVELDIETVAKAT